MNVVGPIPGVERMTRLGEKYSNKASETLSWKWVTKHLYSAAAAPAPSVTLKTHYDDENVGKSDSNLIPDSVGSIKLQANCLLDPSLVWPI